MFDSWKFSEKFSDNFDAYSKRKFESSEPFTVSVILSKNSQEFKNLYTAKFPQISKWEVENLTTKGGPIILSGTHNLEKE